MLAFSCYQPQIVSDLKTTPNSGDVDAFLKSVENETRRNDAFMLLDLFKNITRCEPQMWGSSIVGFDRYSYQNSKGKEQQWMITGFSPRKQSITLYIMQGFDGYEKYLAKLGKVKTSKSCLYINRLSDIDMSALNSFLTITVADMREKYPG